MATDAIPLAPTPGGEGSAKVTSKWDDLRPALPQSVDGSHLSPCPQCGMENGALAQLCWNCEAPLIPGTPLRLVTKDGAEVPRSTANSAADDFPGLDLSGLAASLEAAVAQAPATADSPALPEWTSALEHGIPVDPPPPPSRPGGLDLRVIAAVFAATLIAGTWGYYKAHSSDETSAGSALGTTHSDRPGGAPGSWNSPAPQGVATRSLASPTAGPPGGVTQSVDDALAAAERALSSANSPDTATVNGAPPPGGLPQANSAVNTAVAVAPSGKSSRKRREAAGDAGTAGARTSEPTRSSGTAPPVPGRSCSPTLAALGLCQSP
jgi:hypothetical protein